MTPLGVYHVASKSTTNCLCTSCEAPRLFVFMLLAVSGLRTSVSPAWYVCACVLYMCVHTYVHEFQVMHYTHWLRESL